MYSNSYEGVVDDWKVELVERRARRLGFSGQDLLDAQQEIILDIVEFEFDEARSNGATQETALTSVIDRRLKSLLRTRRRYEQRVEPIDLKFGSDDEDQGEPYSEPIESVAMAIDVQTIVAKLSREQQVICAKLSQGQSITQIAKQIGRSWHTVNKVICRIRERFQSHDVDGWFCR